MNKNYHEGLAEKKISTFILKKIRGQMYKCFINNFKIDKTLKIVDYGSSPQETEDSNFFIKCYPYKQNITSLSIFDNKSILNYFPEITLKTIKKNGKLEFEDNAFDILISNGSSTCLEALASGVPVIIIGNKYGITENPITFKLNSEKLS